MEGLPTVFLQDGQGGLPELRDGGIRRYKADTNGRRCEGQFRQAEDVPRGLELLIEGCEVGRAWIEVIASGDESCFLGVSVMT